MIFFCTLHKFGEHNNEGCPGLDTLHDVVDKRLRDLVRRINDDDLRKKFVSDLRSISDHDILL